MNKKIENKYTFIKKIIFLAYLAVLVYFLFFAEAFGREVSNTYRYNFTPFDEIKRYINNYETIGTQMVFLNLVGNVIGFIPFGMIFPSMFKYRSTLIATVIAGMIFSAVIEVVQLGTRLGSFDIDDVILNTLGTLIGFIIFAIFRAFRDRKER